MIKENATILTLSLICMLIIGCQREQMTKAKPIVLSAISQEFLRTAEGELGSFGFSIVYYTDGRRGIQFMRIPWAGFMLENQVVIDEHQSHLILQYFAQSGLLDKSETHSRDAQLGGWNAYLGTRSVGAFWHLGKDPDAPVKVEELMGLRPVLQGDALEAWDRFLKRLKELRAPNNRLNPTEGS